MPGVENLPLFLTASLLLVLSPGPDTIYIVSRSVAQGRTAGLLSSLGIGTGVLIHICAAALGLTAILATSATAFLVVKYAGALYLIYLGIRTFLERSGPLNPEQARLPTASSWTIFRQGVLSDVLNPKMAVFFLAFLPQFIMPDSPARGLAFVLLGAVIVAFFVVWATILVLGSSALTSYLRRNRRISHYLNRATGMVFVGLGLRLALERARP
jgi:RhtB (resistance to homoserine/threonine) family protein